MAADVSMITQGVTALNAVFPITLRLQFPNLDQRDIINIQLNLFSHLIIQLYKYTFYCVPQTPDSRVTVSLHE